MLIVTVADPKRFTLKNKPVTYTRAFVELYNWRNHGQVYEIHGIIELEKMCASIAKNHRNLIAHQIIEISSILYSAYVVLSNQDKVVFYVNNYIDWDQFNQLYNPDWMEKDVKNVDAVVRKLRPALTRAINQKLEVAREERRKREEIGERRKTEAMAMKRQRARGGLSSSSKEEENYESDIRDETDLDQANDDKNPLQL